MNMSVPTSITLATLICLIRATILESDFPAHRIIKKDVAILGAGASGTYAAVRLREDFDMDIVVIEHEDQLGGHVDTYIDPKTNAPVDYGVLVYHPYGRAQEFFARFNVETVPYAPPALTSINVDVTTGANLSSYRAPSMEDVGGALKIYADQVKRYDSLLLPGYWNFSLPDDIPPELLMPFGEFAERYGVQAAFPMFHEVSNVGVGGVKDILTLYVFQAMPTPVLEGLLQNTFFTPKGGSNSLLYQRAYALLKEDVMLNSHVIHAERTKHGVKLVVQSRRDGTKILIKATRLLITPPPSPSNLAHFALDAQETAVFQTWTPTWNFNGILKTSLLPENYTISFIAPAAAPRNYLATQDSSFSLAIASTGPPGSQLFRVNFATNSSSPVSHAQAKAVILANIRNLLAAETLAKLPTTTGGHAGHTLKFVAFNDHNSILWRQSVELLRAGFVQDLYALQGHRATWYTGGLWCSDYSAQVWAFTETVITRLVRSLQ